MTEDFKSSSVEDLIPKMFNEMRANINLESITDAGNHNNRKQNTVSTQSLLRELDALDKIIPMIENVNTRISRALPKYVSQIHATCQSTNKILDSWVNIHSQAGYIHKIMDESQRVSKAEMTSEQLLAQESADVQNLKQILQDETQKRIGNSENTASGIASNNQSKMRNTTKPSGIRKPGTMNINYRNSRTMPRSKPTSDVSKRLTRPTASSSRKMFR